ncbi:hypothetical protein ACQVP2_23040 [Methylobacterium aquaticum]|uniref:Uncharacterized protein n=1 Tax=Methylobacterium aquaticum TaxID=270351 RepID=A0A0J6S435_9HYPH|nr:hypothetical protein [Methylobacterium aquaticum]KMO28248.1 hypothetical protein VP06_28065 [Methylobacterium aquaticum]
MSALQAIAKTVAALAAPNLKPKELIAAVRKQHPDASKKEISRGAFLAMIQAADGDPDRARRVHEMALASRGDHAEDDPASQATPIPAPKRKKGKL